MARLAVCTCLAALGLAAPASGAVLVHSIPKRLVCGDPITAGIWAQSWTTGDRTVRMKAVDRRSGRVWWRKTAVASKRAWKYWTLPSGMDGRCKATTFVYKGHGFKARFNVRFRSEGV